MILYCFIRLVKFLKFNFDYLQFSFISDQFNFSWRKKLPLSRTKKKEKVNTNKIHFFVLFWFEFNGVKKLKKILIENDFDFFFSFQRVFVCVSFESQIFFNYLRVEILLIIFCQGYLKKYLTKDNIKKLEKVKINLVNFKNLKSKLRLMMNETKLKTKLNT